jgi:hypothetical protein
MAGRPLMLGQKGPDTSSRDFLISTTRWTHTTHDAGGVSNFFVSSDKLYISRSEMGYDQTLFPEQDAISAGLPLAE